MKGGVSIVIPTCNEAGGIARVLRDVNAACASRRQPHEILVCDESSDGTPDIVLLARRQLPAVRLIRVSGGKGAALKAGVRSSRYPFVAYLDADLSTPVRFLPGLIDSLSLADVSIGSRYLSASRIIGRSSERAVLSRGFNMLARLLLASSVSDHQCGFKAFRKNKVLPLLESAPSNGWFFDTQLLVLAQRHGLSIAEVPVTWKEREEGDSKIRSIRDSLYFLREIASFSFRSHP